MESGSRRRFCEPYPKLFGLCHSDGSCSVEVVAIENDTNGNTGTGFSNPEFVAMVTGMLAKRDVFQARARAWINSTEFTESYHDLHPGLLVKGLATLLGNREGFLMRSGKLRSGYQRLGSEGQLLFAGTVICNNRMAERPHMRFPASVVASLRQDFDSLVQIVRLSVELGSMYGNSSDSRPQCLQLINDDIYRPLRQRPLPPEETDGLAASLYDVRFSANEMLLDKDAYPFVPLLVHPEGGPFLVIPWAVLHNRPLPARTAAPLPANVPPPLPQTVPPPLPVTQASPGGSGPEVTAGGSTVLRHSSEPSDFVLADMRGASGEAIVEHIGKYIGNADWVNHELISHRVHLDVHFVQPTPERPFHTLITSGMSDLPMTVPPGAEDFRYAELMLCLPAHWNLGRDEGIGQPKAFEDERNYWPVRWLKKLARFPHEYGTWIGPSHTIPNGDPAEPVAEGVPFTGFFIWGAGTVPDEFRKLRISPEKTIRFYALLPITDAEMAFKLEYGADALAEKLEAAGVSELVDPARASVV